MKPDWRQVILHVTLIGTEGCWLYALLFLLNAKVADSRLAILWILLVYPASLIFNKMLQRLRWPEFWLRIISWLTWAIVMLIIFKVQLFGNLAWSDSAWLLGIPRAIADLLYTFRPELLILLGTAILWWLGRHLASIKINFAALVTRFQFGLIILVIAFLVASQLEVEIADSVTLTLVFFLFALAGVSIAHSLEGASWLSGLYPGHWSGLLLISIGIIILLGLLIGSVITADLMQLIVDGLKFLWGLVMKLIAFIISLLPEPEPSDLPPPAAVTPEAPSPELSRLLKMPETLRRGLQSGWSILFFGLFLLALWRISSSIFSWLRRKLSSTAGAELEPMPGAFRTDLLNLLKRIISWLFAIRFLFRTRKFSGSITPETASVRELYRRFLRWAAAGGYPRLVSQTPHEYLQNIAELLPESRQDLAFITRQYVSARYSTLLQTENEIELLRQSWYRIKHHNLKQIVRGQARGQEIGKNGKNR